MDRVNLLKPSTTKFIIEVPVDPTLSKIDTNQVRIIPIGLGIFNKNQGSTDTSSTYYSSAIESSLSTSDRLGAGFNFTIGGTVNAAPLGIGATVNASTTINMGFQSTEVVDSISADTTNSELIVTKSTYKHYLLYHRKDRLRLNGDFMDALRELSNDVYRSELTSEAKLGKVMRFYDTWGTHYPLGATFGAMAWWETRITEREASEAVNKSQEIAIKINEGVIGPENKLGDTLKEVFKDSKTEARSVGGTSAPGDNKSVAPGDEPVPIKVDLRPIAELMTPQHFPGEPEIYINLRKDMLASLAYYIRTRQEDELIDIARRAHAGNMINDDRDMVVARAD